MAERNSRAGGARALLGLVVAAVVLGACAPSVVPPGSVEPHPGRGRDDSVVVAPSAGCTAAERLGAGRHTVTVTVGQRVRRARVEVPPAAASASSPAPLLLSLHPFSVDARSWEQYSGLAAAAIGRGYVAVTPTGSSPGPRWAVPGGLDNGVDDLAYLAAVLDRVEDLTCVDRNREFAAGFSAGAAMARALSCAMPWRIAAVAASGGANLTERCPDSAPTDVLVLHGTADPIAPVTGSEVIFAPPLGLYLDDVVRSDAARAGCDPTPVAEQPFVSVLVERWTGCSQGHRVELWRLLGAGHTWAGASNPLLELVTGPTNTDISANEVVLDFFDEAD